MAETPPARDSGKPVADAEDCQDYAGALRSISTARRLFLSLLVLSLLVHLAVYCSSRWLRVLAPTKVAQQDLASAAPDGPGEQSADTPATVAPGADTVPDGDPDETQPAADTTSGADPADADADSSETSGRAVPLKPVGPHESAASPAQMATLADEHLAAAQGEFAWVYYPIELVMPLAEFVGQVSCGALVLCYLLAANVALSGRLGGVRGSISAFFWMVVLLALLFPWDRWLGDLRGQVQVPGVYLAFDEVRDLPAEFPDVLTEVLHYLRYLGYPLLAFVIAAVGDRRYARGHRLAQRQIEARLNVRSV